MTNRSARLVDGHHIPLLGFGVYQSPPGPATRNAVLEAFRLGYRHVDTAALYGNETDVGDAVRTCGLPRDQVFITTKLWNDDHGHDQALRAFDVSLRRLGLEYIDLYLIHWPVQNRRLDSWRALCRLQDEGRVRSIGVSNYTVRHLEELLQTSQRVPAVNQVELSPFLSQPALRDFCRKHAIVVEAYSPLTRGEKLGHPAITSLAKKHGRTPAQVMLRWAVQQGIVVLPKSNTPARIRENADIFSFELDTGDLAQLEKVDENFRTCWDPTQTP